jgi:UDP-N-acetylglucosamine transferase subunit ALG13
MSTFVSLGNNKKNFYRLLQFVINKESVLPKPIYVQKGHTIFSRKGYKTYKFLSIDKFIQFMSASKIIIIHGGAGSIINALNLKKKPIVMARLKKYNEHVNNHQVDLVKFLCSKKKIFIASKYLNIKKVLNKKNKIINKNSFTELSETIRKYI